MLGPDPKAAHRLGAAEGAIRSRTTNVVGRSGGSGDTAAASRGEGHGADPSGGGAPVPGTTSGRSRRRGFRGMIDACMLARLGAFLVVSAWTLAAQIPAPADYLGFEPGEDYKLADFAQISGYFQTLDRASERVKLVEFGRSSEGRPMYVAFISSPENLAALERWRDVSRRLALGEAGKEEARELAREGKAIVWIDSGLHATEVAPVQHAPVLAYRLATGESEEIQRILDNVVLMQAPVINPDGLDWVVEWYRGNLGTPYELAPLPRLYQKYAGHDNNRDWFMLNLAETRHVTRLLFREWFPQIVYNQHQQPAFPARIFVPPYAEPLNPNIPAAVVEGVNRIGAAMRERFAREDKPGVISYLSFDAWWNGGLRTAPAFHNMHGILTETAAGVYATPREDKRGDLPKRFRNGLPADRPSVMYPRPWLGGRWGVREAIDYMLTADFALLEFAAAHRERLLLKAYELAREAIRTGQQGNPFAYVVPREQWDFSAALEMLRRLQWAGVSVHRAREAFTAGGNEYAAGSYVLLAAQPFRAYLVDLMEPQDYPDADGKTVKRPYDVAGWTLRMSMGVEADRIDEPFEADLEPVEEIPAPGDSYDHREIQSFVTTAEALAEGRRVRWSESGEILVKGRAEPEAFRAARWELRRPRVALYVPWTANIDTGWTRWMLDAFRVPYRVVRNRDVKAGGLRRSFDTLILASQDPMSILHGYRCGEPTRKRKPELDAVSQQRPEYCGGIGIAGLAELERFVRQGGTLITFGEAARLPAEMFPLGLRDVARSSSPRFSCPGSLVRITLDTAHPLAFGMPAEAYGFCRGGQAWEIRLLKGANRGEREIRVAARYAKDNLLASGWVSGEKAAAGKAVLLEARHGQGRVVLFGFRPQFRGQTFGTMKLVLNAIYLASARELGE